MYSLRYFTLLAVWTTCLAHGLAKPSPNPQDPDCDENDQSNTAMNTNAKDSLQDTNGPSTSSVTTGADGTVTMMFTQFRTQVQDVVSTVTVTVGTACSSDGTAQVTAGSNASGSTMTTAATAVTTSGSDSADSNGLVRTFTTNNVVLGLSSIPVAVASALGSDTSGNTDSAGTTTTSAALAATTNAYALTGSDTTTNAYALTTSASTTQQTTGATLTETGLVLGLTSIPVSQGV